MYAIGREVWRLSGIVAYAKRAGGAQHSGVTVMSHGVAQWLRFQHWFHVSPIVDPYCDLVALHFSDSVKAKKEKKVAVDKAGNYHIKLINRQYPCLVINHHLY